jgi:hypothetical protein
MHAIKHVGAKSLIFRGNSTGLKTNYLLSKLLTSFLTDLILETKILDVQYGSIPNTCFTCPCAHTTVIVVCKANQNHSIVLCRNVGHPTKLNSNKVHQTLWTNIQSTVHTEWSK